MRLLFASITYGATDPEANRSHRAAIMQAANAGHQWIGDISPDHMKWDDARNVVVAEALNNPDCDADAVFWVDSDIVLPPYAIARMAHYQKDFITGIYFQKEFPYWPLIAHLNKEKTGFNWYMTWPKDTLAPIDGCGFGCVLTSVKMLRQMGEAPWFHFNKFSEDFTFCLKAADAGFPLLVDTGIICEHQGKPKKASFEDFKRSHPKFYPPEKEQDDARLLYKYAAGDVVLTGNGSEGQGREADVQAAKV